MWYDTRDEVCLGRDDNSPPPWWDEERERNSNSATLLSVILTAYVAITGYVDTKWRVRVRLSMTPFASSDDTQDLVMTLETLEDLVKWYWSLLKTLWEDIGVTFSSLTSVFFFCDPGRIRRGSVGDFVRGPRSLCGSSCTSSRLRSEHRRSIRCYRWIRVGMFIHCSFLSSGRWFFHGSGRCRCRPFSSQWVPSGGRRHVHSRVHRRYRGRHCWCRRWYGSRLLRLVCWGYVRDAGSLCFLGCAGNSANSWKAQRFPVLIFWYLDSCSPYYDLQSAMHMSRWESIESIFHPLQWTYDPCDRGVVVDLRLCRVVKRHNMFLEVSERITKELTMLAPFTLMLRVVDPSEWKFSVWISMRRWHS